MLEMSHLPHVVADYAAADRRYHCFLILFSAYFHFIFFNAAFQYVTLSPPLLSLRCLMLRFDAFDII